ncbi:MAG: T9SS type A sorting domain-containing protein [Flavobacteriales bacterium]|nr:T9SS type A sorting domain-containing protein [Flavobacteriales bacterium]
MRSLSTLTFLICTTTAMAQDLPIIWHINFDPVADRGMDSLDGCWQIGPPQKPVFNAALTAPNALVTDTLQPYPVGGTSYAEFSVPVYSFGDGVEITFSQRINVDPGEAYGWVEYFDAAFTNDRVKTDPWQGWYTGYIDWTGDGLDTDSALVFTGTNNGWGGATLTWQCLAVLQGPQNRDDLPDSMRFRFAFQSRANTNGADGWMIDDLLVTNKGCSGSVAEFPHANLSVSPSPTTDRVVLELTNVPPGFVKLELFRADGALVVQETMRNLRHVMDLAALPDGIYLLRVTNASGALAERLVVQH